MMTLADFWLPILVSAVLVWLASSLIWMVLPWHKADWRGLPNEEAARNTLRGTPPGQYHIPHSQNMRDWKSPEFQRKFEEGPLVFMTVMPNRKPSMGRQMTLWIVYLLLTGALISHVATGMLSHGAEYMKVFCVTAVVGWLAYGWASITEAIWFGRRWRTVLTLQLDAVIYALLTAGVFGWLWPG